MNNARLQVIIRGPEIAERGMLLDDLIKTLHHLQTPRYLIASRLSGAVAVSGQGPARIRWNDGPPLPESWPGALALEFEVTPAAGDGRISGSDAMQTALDWLMDWPSPATAPHPDAEELARVWANLSPEITLVALHNPAKGLWVQIGPNRQPEPGPAVSESRPATLYGKLVAVDWENRTARLQRYLAAPIPLRFGRALDDEMQHAARQRVKVQGQGRLDENEQWAEVEVEQITATPLHGKPFDLEAFRNNPNPKIFDPAKVIRAKEPFDVDEFLRMIYEWRGKKWPQ